MIATAKFEGESPDYHMNYDITYKWTSYSGREKLAGMPNILTSVLNLTYISCENILSSRCT